MSGERNDITAAPKFDALRFEQFAPGGGAIYSKLHVVTPEHLDALAEELMPLFVKANADDSQSDDYDGTADTMINAVFRTLKLLNIPQSIDCDTRADTYPQQYLAFTIGSKTYPVRGARAREA